MEDGRLTFPGQELLSTGTSPAGKGPTDCAAPFLRSSPPAKLIATMVTNNPKGTLDFITRDCFITHLQYNASTRLPASPFLGLRATLLFSVLRVRNDK